MVLMSMLYGIMYVKQGGDCHVGSYLLNSQLEWLTIAKKRK